jgi:hypothetical protein
MHVNVGSCLLACKRRVSQELPFCARQHPCRNTDRVTSSCRTRKVTKFSTGTQYESSVQYNNLKNLVLVLPFSNERCRDLRSGYYAEVKCAQSEGIGCKVIYEQRASKYMRKYLTIFEEAVSHDFATDPL